MNNSEALAYIDRLWNKYGALYSDEKNAEHDEEAELMQKYFMSLGVAKEALEKMDKLTGAMEEIAKERDKSYEGEAIGHGWGDAVSFGDIREGYGMTREEAIKHGKEQLEIFGGTHREFIEMSIKALEQEPKPMVEIDLYSVIKQKYIEREVLDKLDEIITDALDKSTDQKESQTLRWVLDKISEVT